MKNISIKTMSLTNFKGIRQLSINFSDKTMIGGRNASGKTTIFDAFTWALFGKDSQDRKAFEIKTLGEDGKPIERLPHEVVLELSIDGQPVTIARRLKEKWTKKRGSAIEEFAGNEEERLYNDVPLSVKDFSEKIAAICPEDIFKLVSNPLYFTSLKPAVQREYLIRLAGGISDEEIAARDEDFAELLAKLTGKTLEEYRKETAAKIRRIKGDLASIPARIDERLRDTPAALDWDKIRKELLSLESKAADIDSQLEVSEDLARKLHAAMDANLKALHSCMAKMDALSHAKEKEMRAAYYEAQQAQQKYESDCRILENDIKLRKDSATQIYRNLSELNDSRIKAIEAWKQIKAREISFDDNAFICPTCKRPLDSDDIDAKRAEMEASFNAEKAAELAKNVSYGKALRGEIERTEAALNACNDLIAQREAQLAALIKPEAVAMPSDAEIEAALAADPEYKKLAAELEKLHAAGNKAEEEMVAHDNERAANYPDRQILKHERDETHKKADELKAQLAQRDSIAASSARIEELKAQQKELNECMAELEREDFIAAAFNKARMSALEEKINGLFRIVSFKLFDQQINGGEVETCEAMIGGVPFSALNHAAQISAGVDIINALSAFHEIAAPIILDNAEAMNELPETSGQRIALYVTDSPILSINA